MSKKIDLLINQCKKGNKKAQLHLYDTYSQAMFSVACRYLNNDDAIEVMHEGFLKAFLSINTYKKTYSFGAWLKRIVINQCIDELKRKRLETISIENNSLEIVDEDDWKFDEQISKEQILRQSKNFQSNTN